MAPSALRKDGSSIFFSCGVGRGNTGRGKPSGRTGKTPKGKRRRLCPMLYSYLKGNHRDPNSSHGNIGHVRASFTLPRNPRFVRFESTSPLCHYRLPGASPIGLWAWRNAMKKGGSLFSGRIVRPGSLVNTTAKLKRYLLPKVPFTPGGKTVLSRKHRVNWLHPNASSFACMHSGHEMILCANFRTDASRRINVSKCSSTTDPDPLYRLAWINRNYRQLVSVIRTDWRVSFRNIVWN